MKNIDITTLDSSFISLISKDWALLTSGDMARFNTMTVSWGGLGFLWNKPVVYVFVRPERYTFEFIEENATFTLSFLKDEHKKAHSICGSKSGRDCDKVAEAGLSPFETENGQVAFTESKLVLECKVMYKEVLKSEAFLDEEALTKWYGAKGGMHKMYVAEVLSAYEM